MHVFLHFGASRLSDGQSTNILIVSRAYIGNWSMI